MEWMAGKCQGKLLTAKGRHSSAKGAHRQARRIRVERARAVNSLWQGHGRAVMAAAKTSLGTSRAARAMCGNAAT